MRKRMTSLLLTLVMLLSLVPAMGVTASAAAGGDGTKEHPYVVTTYEELQTAMQKAGGGVFTVKLPELLPFGFTKDSMEA